MFRWTLITMAALAIPLAAVLAASPSAMRVQIVDDAGMPVRDAVVEFTPAGGWRGAIQFPWRMAMGQKNEQFIPGTLVIARGSTVAFPNLDNVRHSVYSFSKAARFEIDLYGRDQTRSQNFPVSGTVALGCNIHDRMRGYIRVVGTPFAGKTDVNGYIDLKGIPGSTGALTVWHPRLRAPGNELTQQVAAGQASRKITVKLR
jgi:hypothetical protein